MPSPLALIRLGAVSLALASGCQKKSPAPPPAAAPVEADAGGPDAERDVRPVYGALEGRADPLAERLCTALHTLPEQRRAACCGASPAIALATECTRNLSAALRSKAVRLAEPEVARCEMAMGEAHRDCAWVGPFGATFPQACLLIVRGTRGKGAACRSSLECLDGLRCAGVGPTEAGRCADPGGEGEACNVAVDVLAVYVRDEQDASHPPCAGYCGHLRCAPSTRLSTPCTSSKECGRGNHCGAGKCAPGPFAAAGEGCLGGGCAPGLRCDQGTCIAPAPSGAACTSDAQCQGGCLPADGGQRLCGPRCDLR